MTLADKIVVLDKGRISQVGTPLELYNSPANKFVASFIGSPGMNFFGVAVKEVGDGRANIELPGGRRADIPVHSGSVAAGVLELGVRPEHLTLAASEDPAAAFAGVVAIVERLGNSTILYIDTPAGQLIVEGEGNLSIKSGEHVGLALAAPQAHLFDAEGVVV
jgi:ABC-type sugar transport system ATPase subunit